MAFTGCDCGGVVGADAAADAEPDHGDPEDAALDSDAPEDASPNDELICDSHRLEGACQIDQRYCCLTSGSKFAGYECESLPIMNDETSGPEVLCWEYPLEPGARLAGGCGGESPCPASQPWCCTQNRDDRVWEFCSVEALYGWSCVDLGGAPAGETGHELEDLIRPCAELEPCPDEAPYCCDNLFCSKEALHGWSCTAR